MKKYLIQIIKHPLLSGSSIVLIGSFFANLLNWVFNLYIGGRQLLSPAEYGIYSSLISIAGLVGIIQVTFTSIFAKYAAQYTARYHQGSLNALIIGGGKFILGFSITITLMLLIASKPIASFLHITDVNLLFLVFITIFLSLLSSLPAGILQGELRFLLLSLFILTGSLLKLALGLLFIFAGFSILGVMFAVLLATLFPFLFITYIVIKKHGGYFVKEVDQSVFISEFRKYSLTFFLATLGITVLTNTDILFVKHFFTAEMSGYYAALSIMGKSIFYLTSPIYYVFFPLIAQKNEKKDPILGTLLLTSGIILLISLSLSSIYFLYPQIILRIFFPAKEYSILTNYLGIYSVFVLVFSLVMLFNNFLLSIGRTKVYIINLLVALLFIILMNIFNKNLFEIIFVLIFSSTVLLFSQVLFYTIYREG